MTQNGEQFSPVDLSVLFCNRCFDEKMHLAKLGSP